MLSPLPLFYLLLLRLSRLHSILLHQTHARLRKVVHNITSFPVSERPGTESYDPVLLGGKSLVDHYPYAAITAKEVLVNPLASK